MTPENKIFCFYFNNEHVYFLSHKWLKNINSLKIEWTLSSIISSLSLQLLFESPKKEKVGLFKVVGMLLSNCTSFEGIDHFEF